MRPSVRGVLLDDDERLVVFRRTVPGRRLYWSVPGGHVEPGDASLEHTLHRELLEELGAVVSAVTPLTTLSYAYQGAVKTQHVYGCRLVSMDPALRHGPEWDDPTRGVYEVERLRLDPAEITSRHLVPEALGAYLAEHITSLPRLIHRSK
ncbi:NUDIX domain-containing protein [Nonomuraea africana]|uniref:8-oxo-dGTP pyrophosphatase MutT (NUDIX family) n=1 Tax=Nonomuraea africana TaxID=46171 RepID=A0ABR9KH20_9ACTN|nr:NUDIX hydrolase [Nonomuraea africana]MBE1561120.1 8-oxo-dGTP pyrophosphatase MutT (NUDIX family) [Nonomuraea africana]